ncbi:MAG: hypothetical protein ACYC2H_11980 [Thermoplasmatota archaeon]
MRYALVVAFMVSSALAGCAQETPAPAVAAEPEDCVVWGEPWSKTMDLKVLTYYLGTPLGGMGGGRTYHLPLSEAERPLRIRFTAEWDAANPLYFDSIQVGFSIQEDARISEEPKFEGTSPLHGDFELLDLPIENNPTISLRAPRNYTTPATAMIAVVDQPITVTMEQLLPCDAATQTWRQ